MKRGTGFLPGRDYERNPAVFRERGEETVHLVAWTSATTFRRLCGRVRSVPLKQPPDKRLDQS